MPTNDVTIDQDWIDGASGPPYVLNAPNTVYTLDVDVNVVDADFSGEPFLLVGNEIVLDFAGHTVYVNGAPVPQRKDSMIYRRDSEHSVRSNVEKDNYLFGGTRGTGKGKLEPGVDIIPASDRPVLNGWARTK